MHRNPYWIIFICLVSTGVLIYTGLTGYWIWQTIRLDQRAQAEDIHWKILELNPDKFSPHADYSFEAKGNVYHGQTLWDEGYLNEWTAREAISRLIKQPPEVWYDGKNPHFSTLQKIFPFKESLYTFLLWTIAVYFIGIGIYVKKNS